MVPSSFRDLTQLVLDPHTSVCRFFLKILAPSSRNGLWLAMSLDQVTTHKCKVGVVSYRRASWRPNVPSMRSRRKQRRGRGTRMREKNGGQGDRDAHFSPAFSLPSPSPFIPATQAKCSPTLNYTFEFFWSSSPKNPYLKWWECW